MKLKDISQTTHAKFSLGIQRWVKKHGFRPIHRIDGELWIGDIRGGLIHGQLLRRIINGSYGSQRSVAMPIGKQKVVELKTWWKRYLAIGRCLLDPKHRRYFSTPSPRFVAKGKTRRVCQWCNQCQHKVVTRRVVKDESWVNN